MPRPHFLSQKHSAPLQQIFDSLFDRYDLRVFVKREDLIHPVISGNKWHKLKYNLEHAVQSGFKSVISFGGAYSNHIHALAYAGKCLGLSTVGVIRGEAYEELNPTLQYAVEQGMHLHYVNRAEYRLKASQAFIDQLLLQYGPSYIIPEGGSNSLAVQGCREIISEIDVPFDVICCACGTGATLAGLISGLNDKQRAVGVAVLKAQKFMTQDVQRLLSSASFTGAASWQIDYDHHFGGYAKVTSELMAFVEKFEQEHNIPIEPIYTGKLLYAIYNKIQSGFFKPESTIIILHSGGLQGRRH